MSIVTSGTLPQGQLEVGVSMVLYDRFTNPAQRAKKELKTLYSQAQRAVQANLSVANQMASSALGVLNQVEGKLKTVFMEEYAEFSDMMTRVQIITNATTEQFDKLSDTAKSLGLETVFTSKDVASGMKYLAMAGNSADKIQDLIKSATYLAAATGAELGGKGGAADLVTNIAKAFRLDSPEQIASVADVMARGTLSSNISIQDLAESIRYSASEAVNLKFNLAQVTSAIGVMGNAGLQGSMAGVSLANMMRQLSIAVTNTSSKGYKALREIGLGVEDLVDYKGDLYDLGTILQRISQVSPQSSTQRQRIFRDIFGVRGQRAAMAMLANLQDYYDLMDKTTNSGGYAQNVAEKYMNSYAGSLNRMKSAWENFRVTFAKAAEPILVPLFNWLTKIAEAMKKVFETKFGTVLAGFGLFVGVVAKATLTVTVLRTSWKLLTSDTLINARNMFMALFTGWRQVNTYTSTHLAQLRVMAAEYSKLSKWSLAKLGGYLGGLPKGYTFSNKKFRGPSGRFMSEDQVNQALKRKKINHRDIIIASQDGKIGPTMWKPFKGITDTFKGFSKGAWLRSSASIGGALLKGLGRFVFGPYGVILTTALTFLPSIISSRKDNTEAIKKNTEANDNLKVALDRKNRENPELSNAQQITAMYNAIRYWTVQMQNIKPNATINLNMTTKDGKYIQQQLAGSDGDEINLDFAK